MTLDGDSLYLVAGIALLAGAVLPRVLAEYAVSGPMAFVGAGLLLGGFIEAEPIDPVVNFAYAKLLAELTVIVALMGVGLAIDRRPSLRGWRATWRLLLVAMPLCIGAVAVLGWGLAGLSPAAALLVGAVLAPTDPVLASDVQVGAPSTGDGATDDEQDEVRFALTSEAGLNDGLAFPFVAAAMLWATGSPSSWLGGWLAWDLLGKVAIGVALGWLTGWLLARMAFTARLPKLRLADYGEPMLALAMTLGVYGLTELVHGYGFIAVFVAALTIRNTERRHSYHYELHHFIEQFERILTWGVLLLLGVAMSSGLFASLTWSGALVGALLVVVLRPVAGWLSLAGVRAPLRERVAIGAFGVRGISSVYYLAFASATFTGELSWLWSTVAFTILFSVIVHGVSATPVMRALSDRRAPASP
ncbi:MAG: cation:proton antiporter [Actinomycetota bacterium]|nr:cation:proton antiporter [Actinomycetota bacterium]